MQTDGTIQKAPKEPEHPTEEAPLTSHPARESALDDAACSIFSSIESRLLYEEMDLVQFFYP